MFVPIDDGVSAVIYYSFYGYYCVGGDVAWSSNNKPIFTDPSVGGPTADAKFAVLQKYRGNVINTFGYPGPPNYAATQTLANFVIPDMVATAVKTPGSQGVEQAIAFAKSKLQIYYTG